MPGRVYDSGCHRTHPALQAYVPSRLIVEIGVLELAQSLKVFAPIQQELVPSLVCVGDPACGHERRE